MMKKVLLAMMLFVAHQNLLAQEKFLKSVNETQELSKSIVAAFKDNKISDAFEKLSEYWPMPQNEIDGLEEKTIKYLNLIEQRFGKSLGSIKVKNETIADIAIRETYLLRYENTALRIVFTFYRNNNGWIVNAFKWDDSFTEEFK